MPPRLAIVVPALNEAPRIAETLAALAPLRAAGHRVWVVDGGSSDDTAARAAPLCDAVITAPRGRASQMNAGAAAALAAAPPPGALLFLHADTHLPVDAAVHVLRALEGGAAWGRFDVRIAGRPWLLRVVAALMNARSRLTGIATGDQAIFVTAAAFRAVGGFPAQPLMEDVELSRRLLAAGHHPACLRARVSTSGRRWERGGVWATILLMWRLRWRYWRGTPADELARAWK